MGDLGKYPHLVADPGIGGRRNDPSSLFPPSLPPLKSSYEGSGEHCKLPSGHARQMLLMHFESKNSSCNNMQYNIFPNPIRFAVVALFCFLLGVSGWMFLLVPAYPGCPGSKAVKRSLSLLLSGTARVGWYQKKHSPAHTHPGQRTSFITFLHLQRPRHPLYSAYVLDSPLEQPLCRSSLVFPLVLNPQLHTPCISSPNHHHLFAAHAHTNAACSAAISMLCHLHLVSLSAPYLGVWLLA